jgi:putative chitinase
MKLDKLKGHIPDSVIAQIPGVMEKFDINTPLRLAHFLAQCGHESGGFRLTKENFKYCGRGYIQLTGKDNYTAFGKSINEDIAANPTWVAEKYALLSAAWFFNKNKLHIMADGGATDAVVTSITKRVNGGTIGLPDRIKHFKEYHTLLS